MKKIIVIFLIIPVALKAQKLVPRFENDTLYTTSGYMMYKGQILKFAEGSGKNGKFRYAQVTGNGNNNLKNVSVVIKKLSDFSISGLGNGYIDIIAGITYKDGSKGDMKIHMAFDKAIENFPGLPSELVVPDEFKKRQGSVADEISKLYKLYQEGVLTQQEFETQKKKLLDQ